MSDQSDVKKDIWEIIKSYTPKSIIFIWIMYALAIFGGSQVYTTITSNQNILPEQNKAFTNIFVILSIVLTIFAIVITIILYILHAKNKNNSTIANGQIDAYIVEQDAVSRDYKFIEINQNVKKTYWVLGVSLTSVMEHEATLRKMAEQKVDIRLCMMNPDIAIDNLCTSSIENNACVLQGLFEDVKSGNINLENVKEKVACADNCNNLLEIYHVLINALHFREYYATAINYKEKIRNSRDSLISIKNNIDKEYGANILNIEFADSFMPMSLTISDAEEKEGRMIVEFHLPFTQHKVLFELYRETNADLFEVFVKFYKTIWDRAKK